MLGHTPLDSLRRVEPGRFEVAYRIAQESSVQVKSATSPFEHDGATETFYYMTLDGKSGFCVRESGELVFVFSLVRGRGDYLVRAAVNRGARHLDCFDGYLVNLYARNGFVTMRRVANWTEGEPDVVYMHHTRQPV